MNLRVILPTEIVVEEAVQKVGLEAYNGRHVLLEKHVDFVTLLVPGFLSFEKLDGSEEFVAVDQGVLVKTGNKVEVSVRHAVRGGSLGDLRDKVQEEYRDLDEKERTAQSEIAKLEAGFVRRLMIQERL